MNTKRNEGCEPVDLLALLDRCKAQVEADPSGCVDNPDLYLLLHKIYLRLCHGNIPDYAVADSSGNQRRTRHGSWDGR